MQLETPRFILRDFTGDDYADFRDYQTDPRYRALYDIPMGDKTPGSDLFSLFLGWQEERPRINFQLGIFDKKDGSLCGCGGIRLRPEDPATAVMGLELAPRCWGRYRLAIEAGERFAEFAFDDLGAHQILSDTSSGNTRIAKIAKHYGAVIIAERPGPEWMKARGWTEVDWCLSRDQWEAGATQRGS